MVPSQTLGRNIKGITSSVLQLAREVRNLTEGHSVSGRIG